MFSVPAFAYPTLGLGQAFNAQTSIPGSSLFEDVVKREPQNICKYSFNYKVVKSNSDVKDLLDISGDLSLKIKADLLKVEGAGKYLNDRRNEEDVTEVLAVMKCTTVCEVIDDVKSVVRRNIASLPSESIGTHYVSSVTYGGEMVASLKFKSLSGDKSNTLHGEVEGKLPELFEMVSGGLKAQLDNVARECTKESDIEIKYYGTVQPEKLPTNFEDLVQLVENFPKRMREMDEGRGVPIKFDLQPVQNVGIQHGILYIKKIASATFLKDFENRYDDLRCCSHKLDTYFSEVDDAAEEVLNLNDSVKEVLETFNETIEVLDMAGGRKQLESSNKAYREALGGVRREGKFMAEWRKISKDMAPVKHTVKDKYATERNPQTSRGAQRKLEGRGYKFNKYGQLRNIKTGEPFIYEGEEHDEDFDEIMANYVYELLEEDAHLQRVLIPVDARKDERRSFFFMSPDALTNDKLMILINGSGKVKAGQWSRKMIINDSLESGTVLPYVKKASQEGFEVLITNGNYRVRGSSTPEEHFKYIWNYFINGAKAKAIVIVAHSYGGVVTVECMKANTGFMDRVKAVAFTNSVHNLAHQGVSQAQREWIKKHSRNWVASDKPLDVPLMSGQVSAGTRDHRATSHAAFRSVFNFFEEKLGSFSFVC